jgi:putative membrane protein
MITFGLFTLIINIGMLYLTEWIAHQVKLDFEIDNVLSAVLGALLISVVSFVLSKILK